MLLNSNLVGIFLILAYTSLLGNLLELTAYVHSFAKITGVIVVIGVIGAMCNKKRDKK